MSATMTDATAADLRARHPEIFIRPLRRRLMPWMIAGGGLLYLVFAWGFFAFGAVRRLPEAALTPALWSVPLVTGIGLILWHWRSVDRRAGTRRAGQQVPAE